MTKFGAEHLYLGLFAGIAAALLLLLLYWLRRRARTVVVPALFLYDDTPSAVSGGSRLRPGVPPWIFFLELAILCFLALGVASVFLIDVEKRPPLVLVLDNSYSMSAALPEGGSVRDLGRAEARRLLDRSPSRRVVWILAGVEPRVVTDVPEGETPTGWTADENASDLDAAITLARRVSPRAEIAVVTDRAPDNSLPKEIALCAVGSALPNAAIVNARRSGSRVLIEVANFSSIPQQATLEVTSRAATTLDLAPGERRKVSVMLPSAAAAKTIEAAITAPHDAVEIDNRAILFADDNAPVRVAVSPELPASAKAALIRVLDANPDFCLAPRDEAELWIAPPKSAPFPRSRLIWHGAESRTAAVSSEPPSGALGDELLRGASLQELDWAAAPDAAPPGEPLIRRGDRVLLARHLRFDGKRDYHLNLVVNASNVTKCAFWPVWFYNLAAEVRTLRPGAVRRNFRAGELVTVRLPEDHGADARLIVPGRKPVALHPVRGVVFVAANTIGASRIESGSLRFDFSVPPGNADESDLSKCSHFRHDAELVGIDGETLTKHIAWAAFLAALALYGARQFLTGKRRKESAE